MPTITAIIHKSQLKFLGHVLRTNFHSHPITLEGDVVFSRGMLYRGGLIGERFSQRTLAGASHQFSLATPSQEGHSITRDAQFSIPHSYLQLRLIAQDRHYGGNIVSVPTHIVADVEDHTVQFFSQRSRDGYECSA